MKEEYINQFSHFWRTFETIVMDFDQDTWITTGFKLTTPAKTAYHILISTQYYINDLTPMLYKNGTSIKVTPEGRPFFRHELEEKDLPTREDIVYMMGSIAKKTENWLKNLVFDAENPDFPWAGKTQLGVVLFLIRHSQYHLGEMNALLNEVKKGDAEDHYVQSLRQEK